MVNRLTKNICWRLHFWAALFATPFVLVATLTGLLYVFTPQIENYLYSHLDRVKVQSTNTTLDEAVAVAKSHAPADWRLYAISPASSADESHQVVFVPPSVKNSQGGGMNAGHNSHSQANTENNSQFLKPVFSFPKNAQILYINPYTLEFLGTLEQQNRFTHWSKKLHSTLLQGSDWRWMIEWGASWLLIMLMTGVILAWPRSLSELMPEKAISGRQAWKKWHAFIGLTFSILSLIIICTGLTWSQYTGQKIRYLRDISGQASPQVPASFRSAVLEKDIALSIQSVWEEVKKSSGSIRIQIIPPSDTDGVWRATHMEKTDPFQRFDLLLDAYSGKVLFYSSWKDQTLFGKATAIGIPFHRGEFGIWNQFLLFIFGAGVIFSLISGWTMFFNRFKGDSFFIPPVHIGSWRGIPISIWLLALALLCLIPLLVIGFAFIIFAEAILFFFGNKIFFLQRNN
jgi:uncharacterized iron-regulated membrane protein